MYIVDGTLQTFIPECCIEISEEIELIESCILMDVFGTDPKPAVQEPVICFLVECSKEQRSND